MSINARSCKQYSSSQEEESPSQLSSVGLLISQARVNVGERPKQGPASSRSSSTKPLRAFSLHRQHDTRTYPGAPGGSEASGGGSRRSSARASSSSPSSSHEEPLLGLRNPRLVSSGHRSRLLHHFAKSKVSLRKTPSGGFVGKRSQEDRMGDPEKMVLDRLNLPVLPYLEGEEQLKLLNLQHNAVRQLEHLAHLANLVFLDLSDNCLESMAGLETVASSLRVLLLARNRLKEIQGLLSLSNLDVLDLSSNEISLVQNVNHLNFLRVLNLSSNQVESVGGELNGLISLVELNLSRNQISQLTKLDPLPKLQRLFLGHNLIDSFDTISCILKMPKLMELHLEGCPLSMRSNYRHFLLSHLVHLRFLDYRRVLDEEKRNAQSIMKKEEIKRQEELRMTRIKENKSKAIQNAREVWEGKKEAPVLAPGELLDKPSSLLPEDDDEEEDNLCPFCEGTQPFCEFCSATHKGSTGELPKVWKKNLRKDSSKLLKCLKKSVCTGLPAGPLPRNVIVTERDVADPALCHLADMSDSGTLSLYGGGSVGAVLTDYPWHPQTLASVHCLAFHFIPFDCLAPQLGRLKAHFYNISHLSFSCSSLCCLPQVNALSTVASNLQSLSISEEGNPITELFLWKPYTVFRLPGLKILNGQPVGSAEITAAEELFGGLVNHTLMQLPKYRLATMLNNPRVRQQVASEKGYSPHSLQQRASEMVTSNPDLLVKAALTYTPRVTSPAPAAQGDRLAHLIAGVEETVRKRKLARQLWPPLVLEFVSQTLQELSERKLRADLTAIATTAHNK